MILTGRFKRQQLMAIYYFASRLISKQMLRNVEIKVSFKKDMDCAHGMVLVEDYNLSNKPRSFIIEVNKNDSDEEKLKTLAHEMVHIKQYVKGELNECQTVWRGTKIETELEYDEQPWEIEAYELGDKLYEEYCTLT